MAVPSPVRAALAATCAAVLALSLAGPASAAPPPDRWLSTLGTAGGTSTNAGEHVLTPATAGSLAVRWQLAEPTSGGLPEYGGYAAPSVLDGVAYHPYSRYSAPQGGRLVASSVTTGAELWSTPLPARPDTGRSYVFGQAISGNLVVVPYTGWHEPGGLVAVNRSTRTIAWSASRPAASPPAGDSSVGGPVVVDGGRAYLQAGEDAVVAYRLTDGALLWQDPRPDYVTGVAAANGQVVTTSDDGGLVVYDGATGARLWSSPWGNGTPVIAGGRIFVSTAGGYVAAFRAAGCGVAVCDPLWTTRVPSAATGTVAVGAADSATVFVSATILSPTGPNTGAVLRLSAVSGRVAWRSGTLRESVSRPVRLGDTVWVLVFGDTLMGWSATATGPGPLRVLKEPDNALGVVAAISGASGSLLVQSWPRTLTAYRVPGT